MTCPECGGDLNTNTSLLSVKHGRVFVLDGDVAYVLCERCEAVLPMPVEIERTLLGELRGLLASRSEGLVGVGPLQRVGSDVLVIEPSAAAGRHTSAGLASLGAALDITHFLASDRLRGLIARVVLLVALVVWIALSDNATLLLAVGGGILGTAAASTAFLDRGRGWLSKGLLGLGIFAGGIVVGLMGQLTPTYLLWAIGGGFAAGLMQWRAKWWRLPAMSGHPPRQLSPHAARQVGLVRRTDDAYELRTADGDTLAGGSDAFEALKSLLRHLHELDELRRDPTDSTQSLGLDAFLALSATSETLPAEYRRPISEWPPELWYRVLAARTEELQGTGPTLEERLDRARLVHQALRELEAGK